MGLNVLIEYPYQEPRKLYDSMEGKIWFGSSNLREDEFDVIWSTGYPGTNRDRLITLEPPAILPHTFETWYRNTFAGVMSFGPPWLEHVVPFKHGLPLGWPDLPTQVDRNPWEHRKNAVVAIMGNKVSDHHTSIYWKREHTLDLLHAAGIQVDCFGRPGWAYKPWYRGELEGDAHMKRRKLSQYRYALCMENSVCPNYMTEKLPEAILAGCIPIYEGPPNIEDWPIPYEYIISPENAVEAVRRGHPPEYHDGYLNTIDPEAINEEFLCRRLFETILELSKP